MLTEEERAEFEELAAVYLDALRQVELHGLAVAGGREPAGSLLVTLMVRLMGKYPVSAFTCQDYLFALIPRDGKQLLYVAPLGAIYAVDEEEEE